MHATRTIALVALGVCSASLGTVLAQEAQMASRGSGIDKDHEGTNDKFQIDSSSSSTRSSRADSELGGGSRAAAEGIDPHGTDATCSGGTAAEAAADSCTQGASSAVDEQKQPEVRILQQEQHQRQHLQQEQQQEQQQQQQQPQDEGAVAVELGDKDGVRIEYVGMAEGTLRKDDHPSSLPSLLPSSSSWEAQTTTLTTLLAPDEEPIEYYLLRCEGAGSRDGNEGGLTVKGVCDNMLNKLVESAQRMAPNAAVEKGAATAATRGLAETKAAVGSSSLGQVLVVATAPLSYLLGILGGMPEWFSDAVFEVRLKDGVINNKDLPQRLILVQSPPRSLEMACSGLARVLPRPDGAAPTTTATATATAAMWATANAILVRLVGSSCFAESPFPGKMVSRPCLEGVAPREGWVPASVRAVLSSISLGGGDDSGDSDDNQTRSSSSSSIGGSFGSGVCECAARGGDGDGRGGRGGGKLCTIRASPGRDPCLYVDTGGATDSEKGATPGGSSKSGGSVAFGADSVDVSSVVKLQTYDVAIAAPMVKPAGGGATGSGGERSEPGREAAVKETLATLQAAAVKRGLPPSIPLPTYLVKLAVGVALLFWAERLSESRVFHYSLSALLGGAVGVVMLLLRAVGNPRRMSLRPLLMLGLVMWMLAATGGGDFLPSPSELFSGISGAMLAFWSDGFANYPWAGKAFYATSALAGVLMTRWQGLFLDEGDGPRGGWFNGQTCIRRVLTFCGLFLVFHGVSDAEVGVAFVLIALAAPTLAHYARRCSMWSNSSKWYRAGSRLSQAEYEKQGDEHTQQALAALRTSITEDWTPVRQLKQASRRKMTLFAQTGEHFASQNANSNAGGGWRCVVQ